MLTVLIVVAMIVWLIFSPPQIYPGGIVSTILYYVMVAGAVLMLLAVLGAILL